MQTAVIIVAAGRGARAGSFGPPKQYRDLAGRPVLARTIAAFEAHPAVDVVRVVVHPDDLALYERCAAGASRKLGPPINGGATRQESVKRGLDAVAAGSPPRWVLIHDAARPNVDAASITRLIAALETHAAAISAVPVVDTLKRGNNDGAIEATVDRNGLWQAQTPQGFDFAAISAAHAKAAAAGRDDFTDDAAIAEWAGLIVALVEGSADNFKLTTNADFDRAARAMGQTEYRTGTGFDVHRFTEGDHVWLCGVKIAHTHKLEGHSDADVGLHALTDAILGALGDGDIGQHFPPSDPKWKGAASHLFLADAARRVADRGGRIVNADITLLCEAPRVGPHRDAMRAEIASILGIGVDRIGVKATTTEGLGFTGRREGIAAMASATVCLPG